jgi:hypothetical protein
MPGGVSLRAVVAPMILALAVAALAAIVQRVARRGIQQPERPSLALSVPTYGLDDFLKRVGQGEPLVCDGCAVGVPALTQLMANEVLSGVSVIGERANRGGGASSSSSSGGGGSGGGVFWVRDDSMPLELRPPVDAHQRRGINAKVRDVLSWCGRRTDDVKSIHQNTTVSEQRDDGNAHDREIISVNTSSDTPSMCEYCALCASKLWES